MALMRGGLGFQNIVPGVFYFLPDGLAYYTPTKTSSPDLASHNQRCIIGPEFEGTASDGREFYMHGRYDKCFTI
jgi:hypothetical protein